MNREDWSPIITSACEQYKTPFFVFSHAPIRKKLDLINQACGSPASNWLSFKTLPLKNLLRWWLKNGSGVEVVSEFELLAAFEEGFRPDRIMVNGVAKHTWSETCWSHGLRFNFDSLTEIQSLSPIAKTRQWRVGLRFHPNVQNDPENQNFPDQFGIPADIFPHAVDLLADQHLTLDTIHIHMRSNVPDASFYRFALAELQSTLTKVGIQPRCIDLGGGLPVQNVRQLDSAWHSNFSLEDLAELLGLCRKTFPTVQEYILENGRFVLSGCGVLVLSIKDIKEIGGFRYLICDGGKTNNALPSDWEQHEITVLPFRAGSVVDTAICGPTCMAFDCISRVKLASDVSIGDKILYFDAGAYHLSWENRFSQPLARVLWHDEQNGIIESRPAESFSQWWGRWR